VRREPYGFASYLLRVPGVSARSTPTATAAASASAATAAASAACGIAAATAVAQHATVREDDVIDAPDGVLRLGLMNVDRDDVARRE
jgi:hypothetical protein